MKQEVTTTRKKKGVSHFRLYSTALMSMTIGAALGLLIGTIRNHITIDIRDNGKQVKQKNESE